MPDPVHAWAAVAPDGTIDPYKVHPTQAGAQNNASIGFSHALHESDKTVWRRAYRAGWRVVPVKIEVMEGAKDG